MPFEVGDVIERDGTLAIKVSETVSANKIEERFAIFAPGDWSGALPVVSVADVNKDRRKTRNGDAVQSILNGILTTSARWVD
jgi:hypothetical protein